jgi:ribonuclease HII
MAPRADLPARPDLAYEWQLWGRGARAVAGLDEAGRGAWAGPVVAAAVILPPDRPDLVDLLPGVRDSKVMTRRQREQWASQICELALSVGVGEIPADRVDSIGLIAATRAAMRAALAGLSLAPDHLLIDHLRLTGVPTPQTPLTHGDARVLSIAAASVVAKVTRDQRMQEMDAAYPHYGFALHKGYGTALHRRALAAHGPTPIHRFTYAPLAQQLQLHTGADRRA